MPYFSAQQTDPATRRAHRAVERLSDLVQALQFRLMTDDSPLLRETAGRLTRACENAQVRLRETAAELLGDDDP
jgi:hypothetical protein